MHQLVLILRLGKQEVVRHLKEVGFTPGISKLAIEHVERDFLREYLRLESLIENEQLAGKKQSEIIALLEKEGFPGDVIEHALQKRIGHLKLVPKKKDGKTGLFFHVG